MHEVFKAVRPSSAYDFTDERMSAGHGLQTEMEHFHRYYLARQLAAGKDVLDVACGEGYGSALLAQVASNVVGLDIDPDVIRHAEQTYIGGNISFRQGSATSMPVQDASIDLIVTLETLEHFDDHTAFFREAKRVLRPSGCLVVSTPDRDVYSAAGEDLNPFHIHELNRHEFNDLIASHFTHRVLFSQRAMLGSVMLGEGTPQSATSQIFDRRSPSDIELSSSLKRAPYLIAICSDEPLKTIRDSYFIETSDINELTNRIPWLQKEIKERIELREQEQQHSRETINIIEATNSKVIAELQAKIVSDSLSSSAMLSKELVKTITLAARLQQSEVEVRRLRGLWPRAELQSLKLDRQIATSIQIEMAAKLARLETELSTIHSLALWRVRRRLRPLGSRVFRLLRFVSRALRLLRHGRSRLALRSQRRRDIKILAAQPLFKYAWYRQKYLSDRPDTDPIAYYVWVGAEAGHFPHPLFDTAWYAARNPGLGLVNPFVHYLTVGMAQNADPHPLFDTPYYLAQAPEAAGRALQNFSLRTGGDARCPTPFFDMSGYNADNPDVAGSGLDPVSHYAWIGAADDRDPHALFETAWYRREHLGAAKDINPLAHWLREGAAAGLNPHRLFDDLGPGSGAICLDGAAAREPLVSIVIPAYGRALDTYRCLYAVAKRSGTLPFEVILSDDGPLAPIAPLFADVPGLQVQANDSNMGFLRNCNSAVRRACGIYIVFLNSDTVVQEGWLAPLVDLARRDASIGMIGCKLLNLDGSIQEAGGTMLNDGWGRPYGAGQDAALPAFNFVREVDVVIGASFLVTRDAWDAVGGFDDLYAPAYYEEFDLAFALRAIGLKVMFQPGSVVTHLDGQSYGTNTRDALSVRNQGLFRKKWARALNAQPSSNAPLFLTRQRAALSGTILVMEDRIPEPDKNAGALAISKYIELLISIGLQVIFYPHDGQHARGYTAVLEQLGVEVLHHPVEIRDWIRENGRHLDYVWASRPYVSGHLIDQLRRDTGAMIIYLTHDLHHLREMRRFELDRDPLALEEANRVREIELDIFKKADCILTFSEDEAAVIVNLLPKAQVRVIPLFFYNEDTLRKASDFKSRRDLLFIGGFNHLPNVDAAIWLVKDVMPIVWKSHPEARLKLVGPYAPDDVKALAGVNVDVTGHVPDLTTIYAASRISINPLRFGAGVKGKIVSSLAERLPVITTTIGNEGIKLKSGIDCLIADTPSGLAAHVVTLLEDDARCEELAAAGAISISQRFSRTRARSLVMDILGLKDR